MIQRRYLVLPALAHSLGCWASGPVPLPLPPIQVATQPVQVASAPRPAGKPLPPLASDSAVLPAGFDEKLEELSRRVVTLADQLRNQGLLNLHNQLESLRADIARLRGAQEEMAHAQQVAERRQKDMYADLDARLTELAKRPVVVPPEPVRPQAPSTATAPTPAPPSPSAAELGTRAYETALNFFKSADYVAAVSAFNAYIVNNPDGALASNALYWLGLAYYGLADYKSSVEAQTRLLKEHPQSNKVPDSTLSMARAQIQLGDYEGARENLDRVIAVYPTTRAADAARKMLTLLK